MTVCCLICIELVEVGRLSQWLNVPTQVLTCSTGIRSPGWNWNQAAWVEGWCTTNLPTEHPLSYRNYIIYSCVSVHQGFGKFQVNCIKGKAYCQHYSQARISCIVIISVCSCNKNNTCNTIALSAAFIFVF